MSGAPYFAGFRFQVWFTKNQRPLPAGAPDDTMADAGFSEVLGLEANIEVKAYPEGGRSEGNCQLVGRATYPNLVLKRGFSKNLESYRWFTNVARGVHPVPRKGVIVELLDIDFTTVVARWTIDRALPVKMKVSDLNAKGGEVAIEELHLAHEGLSIDLTLGRT